MSVSVRSRRGLFDIEREKRWRIWLLFALLLALVFMSVWVLCFVLCLLVPVPGATAWVLSLEGLSRILGSAFVVAVVYWFASQWGARRRLLRAMHCVAVDPADRYHKRLTDIVEEMRLVTGGPRIDVVTVPTVGLNAFAFSDLRGGGVIGITEGALARLSRQQLEAVVAHEFAHVVSGSYVTVTVSCLLFGIYTELGDRLEMTAEDGSDASGLAGPLRGYLWMLETASAVVSAAISRERERQADLAAVRYTRDPLSLAEALRVIGRHPGGAGYIPQGLAPLCIRETQGRAGRWKATHPPLAERIAVLLSLAAVSPEEFEEQARRALEDTGRREHWAEPSAAGGTGSTVTGAGFAAGESLRCPACGDDLVPVDYEGVRLLVCPGCGGRLIDAGLVGKVLARREAAYSDGQLRLADLLLASGDRLRHAANMARGRVDVTPLACPRCAAPMLRRHYDYSHAVEVDRCSLCELVWFEKDELEALQILVERETG